MKKIKRPEMTMQQKRLDNWRKEKDLLQVKNLGNRYIVTNKKTLNSYGVRRLETGRFVCDCPDFENRTGRTGIYCKHQIAVVKSQR